MSTDFAALWPQGELPRPVLCGEDARLDILASHGTGALYDDAELQRIVDLAARLCDVPICLVTMVQADDQVFLARTGLEARSTPRPTSFCAHAMLGSEAVVVPDAKDDPRFGDNALVTGAPFIRFYAGQPLISAEGAPLGALCVIDTVPRPEGLTDLQRDALAVLADAVMRRIAQHRLDSATVTAIERREAQLRRMIDSVPGIAFSADRTGRFDYFNARWQEVTGAVAPNEVTQWRQFIHPDDFDRSLVRWQAAVAESAPYDDRWRLAQGDGSYRWTLARVVPVATDEGGAIRWFGALIDVDDAQREAEARELIASELSHRIKNIFAVVNGLISLRARGREDVRDFAEELSAAMRALGTAHDYVRPDTQRKSDRLADLLADLLAPYDGQDTRVVIAGDPIAIGARAATPLALIFHELATNSAKYGALSHPEGKVAIQVTKPCGGEGSVCVDWTETLPGGIAGPAISGGGMGEEGFGTRMLRMAIEGQLRGTFTREMTPNGLVVAIEVPEASLGS